MLCVRERGEAVGVKAANEPIVPIDEEVRAHRFNHQIYRNWRRHCARGKADDVKHLGMNEEMACHVISIGCTYLTNRNGETNPALVGHDDKPGRAFARPVSPKGGDDKRGAKNGAVGGRDRVWQIYH